MGKYLAAYDIAEDRRRRRVARVLHGFGERVQRSVFLVWLEPDEIPDLRRRLGALLGPADRFGLFPVDERGSRSIVSWQRSVSEHETVLLL